MGDGRILLKPRRDDSLKKSYRMSLISAGSISLDSTFNQSFILAAVWYSKKMWIYVTCTVRIQYP